jgi:hypothetical protein
MKIQKHIKKVKRTTAAPLPSVESKPKSAPAPQGGRVAPPPPDFLLREAMEEPDRLLLAEYGGTIRLLRDEKRFTFREIAVWLQEHGVECDHNSVYREYTKGLSDQDEQSVALADAEEENERA